MAIQPHAAGVTLVRIDALQGSGLESVGYTVNGAEITEDVRHADVPGDQNGGDEGHPIDIQILSQMHRVRLELSTYDRAVTDKIRAWCNNAVPGVTPTPGSFLMYGALYFRLLLLSTNTDFVRNYLRAIPRQPIETNHGTKWRRITLEFECYPTAAGGAGTIYNATTS